MTVVQILPALEQGGVENVVRSLNRVVAWGNRRSVVISSGGRLVEEIKRDGGEHVTLDVRSKNPLTYFPRMFALRRALKRIADESKGGVLVCVHSRVPAWLFYRANRKLGLKWITYAHGANSVSKYSEIMTKGDLVISPSNFLAEFLKKNYPITDEKIRVVRPMVDFERFDPDSLDREFIQKKYREWKILPGQKVSMAIGRISPVKGLENVIRDTQNKLVVIGEADEDHRGYLDTLKKLAADLGKDVIFAGGTDKVAECISLADEVVAGNSEKPESFGLAVAEAYAMNKPVRAKPFGGIKEIMDFVAEEVNTGASKSQREAIRKLCGFDVMCWKTLEVYDSLQ